MQTFVPYSTYCESLAVLDQKRLNKQIVEGIQIAQIVYRNPIFHSSKTHTHTAWANHPAVLMWKDCGYGLLTYINCAIIEAQKRGYLKNSSMVEDFKYFLNKENIVLDKIVYPDWWNSDIHYSHASALLFKSWVKMVVYKLSHDYNLPVYRVDKNHVLRNLKKFDRYQVIKELERFSKVQYVVSKQKLNTEESIFKKYYTRFSGISPALNYYWPV